MANARTRSNNHPAVPSEIIDLTGESPIVSSSRRQRSSRVRSPNPILDLRLRLQHLNEELFDLREFRAQNRVPSLNVPQVTLDSSLAKDDSADDSNKILPCINDTVTGQPTVVSCSICFEPLTPNCQPMATPCGHMFCSKCLESSLKAKKRCPNCQTAVVFRSCIRIYFTTFSL